MLPVVPPARLVAVDAVPVIVPENAPTKLVAVTVPPKTPPPPTPIPPATCSAPVCVEFVAEVLTTTVAKMAPVLKLMVRYYLQLDLMVRLLMVKCRRRHLQKF